MPSLASMRFVDPAGDSMQPLGPPVREVREVAPALPKPTGTPGVVQLPDGKLATNLPLPGSKPLAKCTTGRQPQVGDWVRILSGQKGIDQIARMIGGVFPVARIDGRCLSVNGWSFNWPGNSPNGYLMTEFAEPPL